MPPELRPSSNACQGNERERNPKTEFKETNADTHEEL